MARISDEIMECKWKTQMKPKKKRRKLRFVFDVTEAFPYQSRLVLAELQPDLTSDVEQTWVIRRYFRHKCGP